jgi:hypothetical protein
MPASSRVERMVPVLADLQPKAAVEADHLKGNGGKKSKGNSNNSCTFVCINSSHASFLQRALAMVETQREAEQATRVVKIRMYG